MRSLRPLLACLLVLPIAGCTGGSTETTTGPAVNPGAPKDNRGGGSKATIVQMEDIQYEPKTLKVKVGDTVKWVNKDDVEHDVEAKSVKGLDSELFGKGGTYEYKVETPGTISYICTVHPGMEGTLEVR